MHFFKVRGLARGMTFLLAFSLLGCQANSQTPPPPISSPAKGETSARTRGEDWPSFLGPRGDGTSAEEGIDPALWNPHPRLVWTMPLGISYGAPSVVGNQLLQFDRFGDHERLTCVEASSGKEIWHWDSPVRYDDMYGYNNGPRCSPVVDDGRVYTYGVAGQLSCVELKTGQLLWTKNLVKEYSVVQNFFGVASTPYVFEDLLLVMVGGSPTESLRLPDGQLDLVKPNGTAVVAFDKESGQERYRLGDDLASYASMTVRPIEGKPLGLAFLRSGLTVWEPRTGAQQFNFPWRASMLESVNAAMPITTENQILLSEAYEIGSVLLEVQNGEPKVLRRDQGRWRDLPFRAHWSTPVLIDGFLYGCSGRNEGDCDFRCIRLSDGELQWSERRHERSSVLVADGYLIVLGEHGLLELIRPTPDKLDVVAAVDLNQVNDPSDGRPLLSSPCWAAPILSHGLLYVRGRDRLACFELIPEA